MQLVKATPRSGYSVFNPETDMLLLAVGEWVELNNYWRRRFLDKEVFIDGWIDGADNPGSALDSKNYFGMRAYASISDLMLQTAAEFGEMAWVTDDASDKNGYYRFDRNKQWVKLDEQNFGDLYDYLGRAEQAKTDAEMYAAAALENGGAASIAAEHAGTASNAAALSANAAFGFATAANASSDAALGFASAADTAAQKAQSEVGKIEGFSITAKTSAQTANTAAKAAQTAAEAASNLLNEVENSKQFVADAVINIENTINDITAPKKVLSANVALKTGSYYTDCDVPTNEQYRVDVTETDTQIIQTATKGDGTVFTRAFEMGAAVFPAFAVKLASEYLLDGDKNQKQINSDQKNRNEYFRLSSEDTLQSLIDSLDTSSNVIKRGVVTCKPIDVINLTSAVNVQKMRLDIDGRNAVLKWGGNSTEAMLRVYDSSFTKIKNLMLIGNADNPPLAAILFDNDNAVLKGSNEKCTVQDVLIGRRYLSETDSGGSINTGTPYGKVQNGIFVRAGGYGNNDEFTFRNVVANDASVAGFNLDGDQHIWTSFENTLANGCATGYRLGSNVTMYNVQANRNSVADLNGIRNIDVNVFGLFSEHPKLVINSLAASFNVRGGKWLKNPTAKEALIKFNAGGVLLLESVIFSSTAPTLNYIEYSGGGAKDGAVIIKNCQFAGGDARDFYRIHTANFGSKEHSIDIAHNNFKFRTSAPYADEEKGAQAVNANSSSFYTSAVASKIRHGRFVHHAVSVATGDNIQIPVCLDATATRVRLMNRGASVVNVPLCNVRSMDLGGHVISSNWAAAQDLNFEARGIIKIDIPLFGVKKGDFIIPSSTNTGNVLVLYGYVKADSVATVVVETISTVASNATAQIVGAAKFDESKALYHAQKYFSATQVITTKAVLSFDIDCVGAQIGSHCLVAASEDVSSFLITAKCEQANKIRVSVYNPAATDGTLPANLFFKVCAIF